MSGGETVPCFFITGVSGVGKSTALRLAGQMGGAERRFCFRDIDEAGVPAGVDREWRREQVARWLDEAARQHRQGRMLVLSGVVEPDDVDHACDPATAVAARFCLLDASDAVLAARLHGRLAARGAAADLLRVTGMTPEQYVDAVTRYAAALRGCFTGRRDTKIIDTSALAPEQVAGAVRSWLERPNAPQGSDPIVNS
jgi:hypothetical protein